MYIFLIAAGGYLLGCVSVKGVSLGTSAVLLVALVFGHFGVEIPSAVRDLGLCLFVGTVGLMAGPVFFRNVKKKVYTYLILAVFITLSAAAVTYILGKLLSIPAELSIGLFDGALTSTPGLAAALEATQGTLASVGYGIAYPFGVVGVVLFVQLYPRFMHADVAKEREKFCAGIREGETPEENAGNRRVPEPTGLLVLSVVLALGLLLGKVRIPLPGGMSFSLGVSGGPLFIGLLAGRTNHIGNVSVRVPDETLKILRELGLCLFLLGAGTDAGAGFVDILRRYGATLFFIGIAVTLLPMILSSFLAKSAFHMDMINSLGTITGGMTSTPALGALISAIGTEDVAAAYAAAYPFALVCMVLASQILALLW